MAGEKRKHEETKGDKKPRKNWQQDPADHLSPFAVGVFITCVRGKEGAAVKDALDLFNDYADRHNLMDPAGDQNDEDDEEADIEASIANELGSLKEKKTKSRFVSLKTNIECVIFIKTPKSVDPTDLVHGICTEAQGNPERKSGGRFLRRMTPIVASSDASLSGLEQSLPKALPREFAGEPRKFKIEPTFRNHNVLNRDILIPRVAEAITQMGPHTVDLKKYDVLVMIEVLRGFLGLSVVRDWEKLRKYNLSEIYNDGIQTAAPQKEKIESEGDKEAV